MSDNVISVKGQLSMEFLISLAAYLAFLSLILSANTSFLSGIDLSTADIQTRLKRINYLVSEQRINNQFSSIYFNESGCIIANPYIFCKEGKETVSQILISNSTLFGGILGTLS